MKEKDFKVFYIPKKNGYRKIITYNDENRKLREFHQRVGDILYKRILPSKFAKAYIKKRSIIKNAKTHMYNDSFLLFDIKDFFQSINHNWLIEKLYYEINLNHKKKISKITCAKIVDSCSVSNRGLAVGLIPSPFLANIYLKDFDNILYGNLKKLGIKRIIYTRYADDLVISYNGIEPKNIDDIKKIVCENLKKFGLKLNDKKTRIIDFKQSNHVKITGINITKTEDDGRKLSVGRKRKDDLYVLAVELAKRKPDERKNNEILTLKGLQSFILSVEGVKYEECYSKNMISVINGLGYNALKDLIDSL
ncbi:RNA-directed DNA polymerase [Clostridium gelidum]|uniref:RNA-directed DNA polymerase n=1 Tax=Clostridium gelidum TaxID=704125 RepID=A0ABM7T9Q9_9CLOT|nr:reverse transcriptase family protein [Clostridium gelidum]BCZ48463.1 RNA-directed DNA polymerase [Clostridium gelidum]